MTREATAEQPAERRCASAGRLEPGDGQDEGSMGVESVRPVIPVGEGLPRPSGRWWAGVVAAGVVSLPLAWLLSYAAALPFFLGLFFFVLFGLIIGATAYRAAAAGRPYGVLPLVLGTTLLVALTSGLSIVKESRDFPGDVASRAVPRMRHLGGRTADQFRLELADDVRGFLAQRYPPGGVAGYVRWVLTSGQIRKGDLHVIERGVAIPAAQTRFWWALRVVLSISLLGFGIGSQTLTLGRSAEPAGR